MSFQSPSLLWLLALPVALLVLYVLVQWRRPRYTVRFTNVALLDSVAPRHPGWRRHLSAVTFLLAAIGLVFSLAQPQAQVLKPYDRATIMLAIDVSGSMNATDVTPSRIEALKSAANQFLDTVPPSINIGIVSFSSQAVVLLPPTKDRDQARLAIQTLHAEGGTSIGEAIFACLEALKTVPPAPDGSPVPARIVLMSDGATNMGRSNDEAAAAAKQAGVPVWTIAFGTDHGTIMVPDSPVPVDVSVDKAALKEIADLTGGQAYEASSASQVSQVYKDIGQSLGYKKVTQDVSGYFVVAALVCLLLTGGFALLWSNRLP